MVGRWADVMQRHYARLQRDVRRGRRTVLDPYALEDAAEFFAVATETFFDAPEILRNRAPDLYDLLRDFYQFDPVQYHTHAASGNE
jgi:Mlc titration factor MtfA (ptsG expression regulator)